MLFVNCLLLLIWENPALIGLGSCAMVGMVDRAIVRTEGLAQGALIFQGVAPNLFVPPAAQVVTEYSLAPSSKAVQVSTWVHLKEEFAVDFTLVDLLYFGDQTHRFVPGSVDGERPLLMNFVGATAQDVSYGWYPDYAPFSFFISVAFDIPGTPTMTDNVVCSQMICCFSNVRSSLVVVILKVFASLQKGVRWSSVQPRLRTSPFSMIRTVW